ncbi:hypothetical protein H9K76_19140 [Diaphorobacter ruginosibacter]|uniref:Trypsin-like serine protease n=1 Tax=Diaphorobacter ruginosibacter TaxID=1715720 RepID=A0A7G9RLZ3_9BURK|nr:S1 family peptidase [Diaphorobacter ruginosibacter]QNN56618.1 hypothetical protein H9K76_19140 [Diaphorobacter ruginosibacter]
MKSIFSFKNAIAVAAGMAISFIGYAADNDYRPEEATAGKPGFRTIDEAIDKVGIRKYLTPENAQVTSNAADNTERIISDLGEYYAGTWIAYDDKNAAYQVVATTSTKFSSKAIQDDKNIKVIVVKYSHKQLMDVYEDLLFKYITNSSAPFEITSASLDYQNNALVVRVNPGEIEKVSNALKELGYDMGMLYFIEARKPVPVATIYHGQPILLKGGVERQACTAGFNSIVDGLYYNVITAGHCIDLPSQVATEGNFNNGGPGIESSGMFIGNVWLDEFTNNHQIDAASVSNWNNAHTPSPILRSGGVPIRGVRSSPVASFVCADGWMSGWRCGDVTGPVTLSPVNQPGRPNRLAMLISTNLCGTRGDSGGPVVLYKDANLYGTGLISTANTSCEDVIGGGNPTSRISQFQPLDLYLAKYPGIQLVYQP